MTHEATIAWRDVSRPREVIVPERGEVQLRGPGHQFPTRQWCPAAPTAHGVDDA